MKTTDIQNLLKQRYMLMSDDDKEYIREMYHNPKSGDVLRRFMGGPIYNSLKMAKPKKMALGEMVGQQPTVVQTPGYIGGHTPQATPQQTIADDKPLDAKDGDYIINAAAAEFAGKQDIQKMINGAITSLQEKGVDLRFGNPKMSMRDNVKLAVSQNEVFIPKEIAKEIGYDRLGKINNRGKQRTKKIQEETGSTQRAYQGGFVKKALGDEVVKDGVQPTGFFEDRILPLFGIGGQGDLPSEKSKPLNIDPSTFPKAPPPRPEQVQEETIVQKPQEEAFAQKPDPFYKLVMGAIGAAEGDLKTEGYIPTQSDGGKVAVGSSGVTIGQGVDLGQHDAKSLKKIGYPDDLIAKFKPYFGLKKQAALNALNKNKKNNMSLILTEQEAKLATDLMVKHKIKEYNRIDKYKNFTNLKDQRLNALLIAEHYGGRLSGYKTFRNTLLKGKYKNLKRAYDIGVHRRLKEGNHQRNTANRLFEWYNNIEITPLSRPEDMNPKNQIQIPRKEFTVPDTDSKGRPVRRIGI